MLGHLKIFMPLCVLALWKSDRLIARLKTPKRVMFSERILGFLRPWSDFCCGYVHNLNHQSTQTSQFSISLSFNLIYLGQLSVNNLIQTCSSLYGDLKSVSRQTNVKQTTYYANKNHLFLFSTVFHPLNAAKFNTIKNELIKRDMILCLL